MKIKIAVVQFKIALFQPEKNLHRIEGFIKKAAKKADIIVFPEEVVTGHLEDHLELVDAKGLYLKHFQALAKKYKIDIVPGSIVEKERGKIYQNTYYIDSKGKVLGKYSKVNLWHCEKDYMTAGKKATVVDTKYGKIGLIICWDLFYPEIFREMFHQGVQIVVCAAHWLYEDAGPGVKQDKNAEVKLVNSICSARAFENEIFVVFANVAHTLFDPRPPFGRSQIAGPFTGALKILNHNREKMFIQEIDTAVLKDAEIAYQVRADLKK